MTQEICTQENEITKLNQVKSQLSRRLDYVSQFKAVFCVRVVAVLDLGSGAHFL